MRVLISDPSTVTSTLYRRYQRRALFGACMAGTMSSFSSYLSLNALLLSRSETDSLSRLTSAFGGILSKAAEVVAEDPRLLAEWGFPPAFADLIGAEPPSPIIFGRFDFLLEDGGGWQVVEYNSDTPSGLREATAVDETAFRLLGRRFHGERINSGLGPALAGAILEALKDLSRPCTLGFVTDSFHLEDMAQSIYTERLVRDALREAGEDRVETVVGDIKNLDHSRGHSTLVGKRIDALYRYYPFETMLPKPQFYEILTGVAAGRLKLLNGPRGLLIQNKGLLAWVWEHRRDPLFSAEEQSTIANHLPETVWVRECSSGGPPPNTVIKQVFGREGEEVYLSERLSGDDWARIQRWQTYIVQRRVLTHPIPAVSWDWKGEPVASTRWPSVGSFTVSDKFAGCYSRMGGPILTSQAEFAPTFVESDTG